MKYRLLLVAITIVIVVVLSFKNLSLEAPLAKIPQKDARSFAVIGLFTSEGCSSCPAADAEVQKIETLYPENVYVLGFHVDYWNRLGWKDVYSDATYSARQPAYADQFNLPGVYTPQVVVNVKHEFVRPDVTKLNNAIREQIMAGPERNLEIKAAASKALSVRVRYSFTAQAGYTLNIALVQTEAITFVKSGENDGATLRHTNIVRVFRTVKDPVGDGEIHREIPRNLSAAACKIIACAQHGKTGSVATVESAHIN